MKKLLLVMALLFLCVSTALATGEGQGAEKCFPTTGFQNTVYYFGITYTVGTMSWTSGSKYILHKPAGWTAFTTASPTSAGFVSVTATNGNITSWVTNGTSLTVTVANMTGVVGKIYVKYNKTTSPAVGGNHFFYTYTDPDGGNGALIGPNPFIALQAGTVTFTKTNTPAYSPTRTPTYTITSTLTKTLTLTPTNTHIFTATTTKTVTPTITRTYTKTATETIVATETSTSSHTPTKTVTRTVTETIVATSTFTYTVTPQQSPIPVSIGAVVKGKFLEAQEKGLLYNWQDEIATGALDTIKQYEMLTSIYDSYTFKMTTSYTGQVVVRIYRIETGDSAGGTTITAHNASNDLKYMNLVANTVVHEDGGYNTKNGVCVYSVLIGGGNTKEIYSPVLLSGGYRYIFSIETKETDNEGILFVEFYGN